MAHYTCAIDEYYHYIYVYVYTILHTITDIVFVFFQEIIVYDMRVPMTSKMDEDDSEPARYGQPIKEFMVNNSKVIYVQKFNPLTYIFTDRLQRALRYHL